MGNSKLKQMSYLGFLSALAIVFNLLESMYIGPVFMNMRIGLANIASMAALVLLKRKGMVTVNVLRVFTASLLQGTLFGSTFWISLAGVTCATVTALVLYRDETSVPFLSVCSAMAHSLGQLAAVMALYRQTGMAAMAPYLILISIGTGLLTGYTASLTVRRIRPLV